MYLRFQERFGSSTCVGKCIPCKILTEISARSRRDLGGQKLAEILGEISKSRRDSRRDRGEISKSRRPKTRRESRLEILRSSRDSRRDLGEISESRRPKTRRDLKNSPRILARFQVRSRRDLKVSALKNLLRILARYQNHQEAKTTHRENCKIF